MGYGVIAGLTAVDPRAYRGWKGDCPGCDLDANNVAQFAIQRGHTFSLLHNDACTAKSIDDATRHMRRMLAGKKNCLYFLTISGHGGQERDTSGDEADGLDETLCLWDGPIIDDHVAMLINGVPNGNRVFVLADTCNSGSNSRSYNATSVVDAIGRRFDGPVIHFGGCDDGESSFGSRRGGAFTNALKKAWGDVTYQEWYDDALDHMDLNHQHPTVDVSGDTRDVNAFLNMTALT